jgi:hypothetical protein
MALSPFWKGTIGISIVLVIVSPFLVIDLVDSGVMDAPDIIKTIAHYIVLALSPILPLVAPLQFGTFLKVWKRESWPQKKLWMFITSCWALSMLSTVYGNCDRESIK